MMVIGGRGLVLGKTLYDISYIFKKKILKRGDIIALTYQFFMRGRRGKGGMRLVVEGEDLSLFFPLLSQTLSPENLR